LVGIPGVVKFILKRGIQLFLVTVLAVYVTILVANMGGYVDEIIKGEIRLQVSWSIRNNPQYKGLPPSEIDKLIEQRFKIELERRGLDKPFIYRSFSYLWDALTLNLGRSLFLTSDSGSKQVRIIILERLPQTVLLFTTATLLIFFSTVFLGLYMARNYGGRVDRTVISLTPLSAIPGWFYGIFMIMIFASWLRILPYGGLVDVPPPKDPLLYVLSVLKHMILPLLSWVIAGLFIGSYSYRALFLIFSTEDFVEVARAKGVPPRKIELNYIFRMALPTVITRFSLALISSWTGAIITETVFNWPGLGTLTWAAIGTFDTPILIGVVIIYAYLLMATILSLDIAYGFLDPRIRVGGAPHGV